MPWIGVVLLGSSWVASMWHRHTACSTCSQPASQPTGSHVACLQLPQATSALVSVPLCCVPRIAHALEHTSTSEAFTCMAACPL